MKFIDPRPEQEFDWKCLLTRSKISGDSIEELTCVYTVQIVCKVSMTVSVTFVLGSSTMSYLKLYQWLCCSSFLLQPQLVVSSWHWLPPTCVCVVAMYHYLICRLKWVATG